MDDIAATGTEEWPNSTYQLFALGFRNITWKRAAFGPVAARHARSTDTFGKHHDQKKH